MTDTYLVLEGLHNEDPKHDARLYQVAVVDCGVFHWVMESDQPAVIDEATLCSSSNLFAHAIRQQTASKPCPGVFSRRSRKHKHNDDGHNHSPPMRIWFGLFGPNRFAFDVENPEQIVDADTIEKVLRTSMIRVSLGYREIYWVYFTVLLTILCYRGSDYFICSKTGICSKEATRVCLRLRIR